MDIAVFDVLYDYGDAELTEEERASVLSAADALIRCVNTRGRVDLGHMAEVSGKSVPELIAALAGRAIFQDPAVFAGADAWDEAEGWLLASQYLCGSIPEKLRLAKEVNARFCCFDRNIAALERLSPGRVDSSGIHFSLGATWIPVEYYARFIASLLEIGQKHVKVIFNKELSVYVIEVDDKDLLKDSVPNRFTYGTPEMPAVKLIECAMNARTAKVHDYHTRPGPRGKCVYEAVLNRDKTVEVQKKQEEIIRKFDEWVHENKKRVNALCDLYNDSYVGYTFTPFEGSFLDFADLNPEVSLYQHQKNSVARILLSEGNLLLAHDVGTGKTYEIVCGVHELYRTGLSRRNLIVVPNSVLQETAAAHRHLYPQDRILVVEPADFTVANRNDVLEQIRDGDFVAAYMAFSSFDMVVMSVDYTVKKQQERIAALRRAAASAEDPSERRLLAREADALADRLSKYALEAKPCPWLTFDQLGVETLIVDEAHNYKNISLKTRADNITGLHTAGSKKCVEMFEKAHFVKRLIMTTGTPLTNSLADLFVMQSYLQQEELRFRGIDTLDNWVNTFAERETDYEIDVDARHLRLLTRFSRFHNLPELLGMFSMVCDFYSSEDKSGLPLFRGHRDVLVPRGTGQELYIESLSARVEALHSHEVKREEDNLLKITTEGRLCAVDIRLVDEALYDEAEIDCTKVAVCAARVMQLYREHEDCCQLVFSDIGTPKAGFNVYDALKERLVACGMPASRIAFVHEATTEAAREKLFAAMNRGRISVCVGSTQKLGTGVNVQKKLVALHHLDVPWKPADIIQREGRILRQGNTCDEVYIYHYVTEGTFDGFSWQVLEKKAKFLDSFLSGVVTEREAEEIDNTVLRYSEIKALCIGNSLIRQQVETANRLSRARIAFRSRQRELHELRELAEKTPAHVAGLEREIATAEKDDALFRENSRAIPQEERQLFGEELLRRLARNIRNPREQRFGSYRGFDVILPAGMRFERSYIVLRSPNGGSYEIEMDLRKPLGCSMRIDYMLTHLPDRIRLYKSRRKDALKRLREAQKNLSRGNDYEREVAALEEELTRLNREIKSKQDREELERKAKKNGNG